MNSAPQDRYLYKPFIGSSHSWAISHLDAIRPGQSVLDIGAGSGIMGSLLADRGVRDLSAVEIDPRAQEHLRPIYPRVVATLGEVADRQFDLILLLDVLEHLTNPHQFLAEAAERLAPGGTILLSVPNVAHWSVRLPLLFGYFEYTERGILDKTHYSFFTRRRFDAMIRSVPTLDLVERSSSIPPVEFVLPKAMWDNEAFRTLSRAHLAVARALPSFFAYQHLAMAKRR